MGDSMLQLLRRVWYLLRHRRLDADLAEEMEFHREMKQREYEARGVGSTEAGFLARRELGNRTLAQEDARAVWIWPWVDSVRQDVAYGFRALRREPGFTTAALLTLTLGIGANTAIFSVVNAVLLAPAPYPEPQRLVSLGYTFSGARGARISPTKFNVWRDHTVALQDLSAVRFLTVNLTDVVDPVQLSAGQVNAAFFRLLGAPVVRGRAFAADEDRPGGTPVAVLSYGFWQRRFGGDPQVVGRSLPIDGRPSVVVGIVDATFNTAIFGASPDLWLPLQLDPARIDHPPSLLGAARLAPGVTLDAANADARLAAMEFHRAFPDASASNDTFWVGPLRDVLVSEVRSPLRVLLCAVGLVLLMACANVANLLLARASARQGELAVRVAIGASRSRLVRQLLTESLVLSLGGGALGLAVGAGAVRALVWLNPGGLPRIEPDTMGLTMDWRVLAFTLVVSIATGLAFGVLPAIQSSRMTLAGPLMTDSWRTGTSHRTRSVRALLVMTEMALAIVLMIGAALLIRTVGALATVDRGFTLDRVVTARMSLTDARFAKTSDVARMVREGVQRIDELPGVVSAAAAVSLPLQSDWLTSFLAAGRPPNGGAPDLASYRVVSPEYLAALEIPLLRGRAFSDRDDGGAPAVALINERMARQISPGGDALHERITLFPGLVPADDPPRDVIGIVADVRDGLALNPQSRPTAYIPLAQAPDNNLHGEPLAWIVRTRVDTTSIGPVLAKTLERASGGVPVAQVRSMAAVSAESIGRTRFQMVLMAIFGGAALLLAGGGVYGVMAYTVQRRTREIGIRLALGAESRTVRNMVVGQGLRTVAPGIAVGLVTAFGFARVLDDLLFGVTRHDPLVFAGVPLLLTAVSFLAVWLPGRRASRVDPAVTLRAE
jgi:predicted permease